MNNLFLFLRRFRDKATGLSAVQSRFDILQNKLDGLSVVQARLDILQNRLDGLDDLIRKTQHTSEAGYNAVQARFDILQNKLDGFEELFRKTHGLPSSDVDEKVFARAESILSRAIELGKRGQFKVAPEFIAVAATEKCNLQCIMCPGHAGKSGAQLSVDEAEMLFCSLADKEDINYGRPKYLDMTAGEPTLNSNLGPIYRRFKELFPDAKISMISNATLPLRGRIREAFELTDRIGLSVDGATAETFERIRRGSVYKNVVRNIRDIAAMKKQGVNCETLQLLFVAMDQNIHELPEMVRLAHSLGVPGLFAQVSEVRTETPFNVEGQNITLSLSDKELAPFVIEAKSEAERLGINLSLTLRFEEALTSIQPTEQKSAAEKNTQPSASLEVAIKTCSVPWLSAPRICQNKDGIYPTTVCCHMPHADRSGDLGKRTELKNRSIIEMFNSEFYWNIRSGLLDGTLAKDACEDCQYFQMTQWNATQLRELEAAVNAVDLKHRILVCNR
jgi:MoaA/NifB/PqqE/SkfB family radical SAM enzyme